MTSAAKDFIFHAGARDKFSRLKANEALLHPFVTRKLVDDAQLQRLFEPSPRERLRQALASLVYATLTRLLAHLRRAVEPQKAVPAVLIDSVLIDSRVVQTQPISLGFPKRVDKQQIVGVLASIIKKKKDIMKSSAPVPRLPHQPHFRPAPAAPKKPEALQQLRPKEDGNCSTVLPLIPRRQVSCKEFDERETLPKSQLKYIGLSKEKISVASKIGSNAAQTSVDSPLLPRKHQSTRKPASFSGPNQEEPLSPQKKVPSTDRKIIVRNSIDAKKEVLKKPGPKKPSSFKPSADLRVHFGKEPSVDE